MTSLIGFLALTPNTERAIPMTNRFLNNEARATVLSGIRPMVVPRGGLDLAVSYIQVGGWHLLASIANSIAPSQVRLLVTDQFDFTHPEALQLALDGGVQLRRYAGIRTYHPKVFLARDPNNVVTGAVVGSANLSDSGMSDGIEGAVVITDGLVLAEIGDWFNKLWNAPNGTLAIDSDFIKEYRVRWRPAARARARLRRLRRRKRSLIGLPSDGHPEDIEVLEDVCETIRVPVAILSMDQAANNIRNLQRLLTVLHAYPNIHSKALSELRLLGLAEGDQLTAAGRQCQRCSSVQALARAWCRWVKATPEELLLTINPHIAAFRRAATAFWRLRREVQTFFVSNLEVRHQRNVLMAIELLCSAGGVIRELKIEDFRALAPILAAPQRLPMHLREAIEEYHRNKGARSWTGNDRRVLLDAWRDVE
jgi:HKD family nuclease